MYTAYFVNVNTAELKVTSKPQDNPSLSYNSDGWSRISEDMYNLLKRVQARILDLLKGA